ncbi:MAG: tetratricopeptide repeat protein [Proteobacteria bacterium]|nr:tetratricopeptide repeat protein [Pseudomonadota bacterium]MBI3498650.1 tetratricopeptide repeat protein [Pseudomonadota bacterium]
MVASLVWLIACAVPVIGMGSAAAQSSAQLDVLFERLHKTQSEGEASAITRTIWALWTTSDDSNVNELMRQGLIAMQRQDLEAALDRFDQMVKYAPEFAEGWNKRATVYYMMGQYPESVADIERVLELEPRHFGALSGLGMINVELDRKELAMKAFEAALQVNPFLPGAKQQIEALRKKIKGAPT